jgi:DtxR family Mn-dependent transcriptional regulator
MRQEFILLYGVLVLILLIWTFWPKKGLIAKITRARMSTQRVLLEDALKFLFDCEYKNLECGLSSIAGNLHINTDKATIWD